MIELHVYTTRQPIIDNEAEKIFNLRRQPRRDWEVMEGLFDKPFWKSSDAVPVIHPQILPFFMLYTDQTPFVYRGGPEDLADEEFSLGRQAKEKGITLPEPFIEKLRREQFDVVADAETRTLLQQYPYLEKLTVLEPLWGILRLSEGKPVYGVNLESSMGRTHEALERMVCLAQVLAAKYHGFVYNELFDDSPCEEPDLQALAGLDTNSWEALAEFYR